MVKRWMSVVNQVDNSTAEHDRKPSENLTRFCRNTSGVVTVDLRRMHRWGRAVSPRLLGCTAAMMVGALLSSLAGLARGQTPGLALDVSVVSPDLPGLSGMIYTEEISTVGWSFRTRSDVLVDRLGVLDWGNDGLTVPHWVGIWDSSGRLLTSSLVERGVTEPLVEGYRFATIAPTLLHADQTWTIGATVGFRLPLVIPGEESSGLVEMPDAFPYGIPPLDVRMHPSVEVLAPALGSPAGSGGMEPPGTLMYPTSAFAAEFAYVPNFQIVPEPGLCLLGVIAVCVLHRRPRK